MDVDTIIVGGGSAGCALAARLSERSTERVLVIEAGPDTPPGDVPEVIADSYPGLSYFDPSYHWQDLRVHARSPRNNDGTGKDGKLEQAKVMGGGSSINGQFAVRGFPLDFAEWEAMGLKGWGWQDMLACFKRLERDLDFGDQPMHGRDGPMPIRRVFEKDWAPYSRAIHTYLARSGYRPGLDLNAGIEDGLFPLPLANENDRRVSTATGYLNADVRKRANLTLMPMTEVRDLLLEGRRVVGVQVERNGKREQHRAKRVVISAGALHTPPILMRAGIGPAGHLRDRGITVVHDLPGVGENFLDHLQSRITYACTKPITLNDVLSSKVRTLMMGAKYIMTRKGLMATPSATAHANVETPLESGRAGVKIQVHHLSGADRYANTKGFGLDPFPGFAIGFFQLRPASRGSIHINSAEASADPIINPNYMAEETDRAHMLTALRLIRNVMSQSAIKPYVDRETRPGPAVTDDRGLLDYIKTSGQTSWHPIGTCKMGVDEMAVVSPDLKVRGLDGLRVVDSSVMPTMPSSNTNAASIMIGEKAADMILGRN